MLNLSIKNRINSFGGYGSDGEVIYEMPLQGSPSVLVSSIDKTTLTTMSNGSVEFKTHDVNGKEIQLLRPSFDSILKREICVPSQNIWLSVDHGKMVSSLINPEQNINCTPKSSKVIKISKPERAMFYVQEFDSLASVVKLMLINTPNGPALLRAIWIKNTSDDCVSGSLWSYFASHGTQFFSYNKDNWYDIGMPINDFESIVSASVPYSDQLQIKRFSSYYDKFSHGASTCDYQSFVGGSSSSVLFPYAVLHDKLSEFGAKAQMNRFSTPAIAAGQYIFSLLPGEEAILLQSMNYIATSAVIAEFRRQITIDSPLYNEVAQAFCSAGRWLLQNTSDVTEIAAMGVVNTQNNESFFSIQSSARPEVAEYANSVWTGVDELYENCRAHGAILGDGIEIGTRDRAQDMWIKMKQDPARVRADLIFAMSFMIMTDNKCPQVISGHPLSLEDKLHGTFPRQYPSVWRNRNIALNNDNRPYADSPLWLLNAIIRYLKETGDTSILAERVFTVKLLNPSDPVHSGMVGNDAQFTILEVIYEVLGSFERMTLDSPYGMAQILYGDWCDPVDMFGTSIVGDGSTRGKGRGVGVRLSLHLFEVIISVIDQFDEPDSTPDRVINLKLFANRLRRNIIKWGFEENGFIDAIHEHRTDGTTPDYSAGEKGYTLGSMRGTDFDGKCRRVLTPNAYGVFCLSTNRDYLDEIYDAKKMLQGIFTSVNDSFDVILGLPLYTYPVPNNEISVALVGRMGVIPAGTAENGEYHHGQMFMHYFRSLIDGEKNNAFRNFIPVMSASRQDNFLGGPFDMPSTSYASDKNDPHYGMGMYFGLSGSAVWIIEYFEKMIGIELNLASTNKPDLEITPRIPDDLKGNFKYHRIIHRSIGPGIYKKIPLQIEIIDGCAQKLILENIIDCNEINIKNGLMN